MTEPPNPEESYRELSDELQDTARWLSGGGLSPEQFRWGVTLLKDRKLQRFGLKITSGVSGDGLVHFTLRFAASGEFCSSMNVDSATGEITTQYAGV